MSPDIISSSERNKYMRKLSAMLFVVFLVAMLPAAGLAQGPQPAAQTPQSRPAPSRLGGTPGSPAAVLNVLLEQVPDGYGSWASQCFPDIAFCYYTADDFVNAETWSLDTIFVDGIGEISNASALNWYLYPDAGGVPAGQPGDGAELWSLSLPPTAPGVAINGGQVTLDLVAATGSPLDVPAGHWWLIFYPDMLLNPFGQWSWNTGSPNQYWPSAQWVGGPPWVPQFPGMAFRLEGEAGQATAVHINKMKMNWAPTARPGWFKVVTLARIHDENDVALAGATVYGDYTYPDGTVVSKEGVTDVLGRAKFPIKSQQTGAFGFCVTDVTKGGYVYDPADNEDGPCKNVTVVP